MEASSYPTANWKIMAVMMATPYPIVRDTNICITSENDDSLSTFEYVWNT